MIKYLFKSKQRKFWIINNKGQYQIDFDRLVPDYIQFDVWLLYRFIKKRFKTKIVKKIRSAAEVLWILNVNGQSISIYQDWTGVNIIADDLSGEDVLLQIIDEFRSSNKFIEQKQQVI